MTRPQTPTAQLSTSNARHRTSTHESLILVLLILLLCTVAVAPLLRSDSPCSHDGAFHYYRVAAMRHALGNGILFTRYLPDLAFGYGYPFFNYRAALSYYLALTLHVIGLALPVALNVVYVLSILGSGLAAYLLARDLFGPLAGIVAAVAYAYAPYQFLDALLRANAPESVALPLMPLILWAFRRLALTGRNRWFIVSVGSLVALFLSHNISSLLFAPFLLAYLIVLWMVYRQQGHWLLVVAAFALPFGLAAAFLAPALLEQEYAQLHMSRVTRNNDFHYNFLSLAEIFAPPAAVDTSLMNPPMRVDLGLLQTVLGGLGFVTGLLRWRDRERRATLIFLALTAAAMLWMSTRSSLWIWEQVPLLPFIQFPWRLVGRAILPVSLLAGAFPSALLIPPSSMPRFTRNAFLIAYCTLVALLILSAFPYTYPPQGYCSNAPYPTITDVFAYEHRSKLVGVDPEGSYFPVWVRQRPEEGSPLEAQYAAGSPIERFDQAAMPMEASIVEADYGPNRANIIVETPMPFRARYLAFYFPGWQVQVDRVPATVTPTDPEGLISFDVPVGTHTIDVRFGSTPSRTVFTAISLLSLAAFAVLVARCQRVYEPTGLGVRESSGQQQINKSADRSLLTSHSSFLIGHCSLAIVLLVFKLTVVDRRDTPFRRPTLQPDLTLPSVEHALNQPYANGLTLVGYAQAQSGLPADAALRLDLYWTAHDQPGARYQSVVHLVGPDGMRWSGPDSFRPRGYAKYPATNTWIPGRYALDSHEVEPLSGTPPGTYDVVLTTFDRDTLVPLSVLNEQGQPAAPELTLERVTLTHPRHPATLPADDRLDIPLADFVLATADLDRDQAAPGDTIHLALLWQAEKDGNAGSSANQCDHSLTLIASSTTVVASYPLPAPTLSWRKGDVWLSQHRLTLPASLETSVYTWTVERCGPSSDTVGQVSVVAPSHNYTAAPTDIETGTRLGDVAILVGANLRPGTWNLEPIPPGTPLTVTLFWRAENTPAASYHVFLHALDPDGRVVAQSDGVPARWSRPTTGWLPGEYIADRHTLTVPPDAPEGDYTLFAGLYIPRGERLTTPDGSDAVHLLTLVVESR